MFIIITYDTGEIIMTEAWSSDRGTIITSSHQKSDRSTGDSEICSDLRCCVCLSFTHAVPYLSVTVPCVILTMSPVWYDVQGWRLNFLYMQIHRLKMRGYGLIKWGIMSGIKELRWSLMTGTSILSKRHEHQFPVTGVKISSSNDTNSNSLQGFAVINCLPSPSRKSM